jgi:hypothetical protein
MMKNSGMPGQRLFVILFLVNAGFLFAQASGSTFVPRAHSEVKHSLLNQNSLSTPMHLQEEEDGLTHPFRGLSSFTEAFTDVFTSSSPRHDLFSYRHPKLQADMNIYAGYEADFTDSRDYYFWYKGWKLEAVAWNSVFLRTDWYNGAFYGDLDAAQEDTLIDGYYKRFDKHIQLDNLSGELAWQREDFRLALGRGRFQIGNSISGSVILNDKVNDYAYFLGEATLGDFRLSLLHGSLIADSTYSLHSNSQIDARHYPDKYLALHQLSYFPISSLELYLGESVIYGNRGIDLNYLLPNSFWRAVEHNLWDRDNVMIFAGGNFDIDPYTLLYAQFALDEFSYSKIFTNWWGNKYALQAGLRRKLPPGSITLEATAVRPYTYAHFMNHTMYSHDGRPLGYPQGSNLLDISTELNIPLKPYLQLDSRLSWRQRGSEGNDWRDNYHDIFGGQIDSAEAQWFAGTKSTEYQIVSSIAIPIMAHLKFLFGHDSLKQTDWNHKLFAAWQFIY